MSPKQELALAIVLWQQFRQLHHRKNRNEPNRNFLINVTSHNLTIGEQAIEMAKQVGVKEEYLRLLFIFPITDIEWREVEKWNKTELGIYLNDDSNFTEQPKTPTVEKKSKKIVPWAVSKHQRKPKK